MRVIIGGLSVLLTLFHLQLLWGRVADGSVLDPGVAAEWAIGLILLLGLLRLHRSNASLFRGRGALTLWLLVLILHALAAVPGDGDSPGLPVDRNLLVLAPLGVLVGFALLQTVGGISRSRPPWRPPLRWLLAAGAVPKRVPCPDLLSSSGPRAPPG
ncbi:MAG: hypothetical protein OEM62_07160 [Acidobacteriota bacterium]|nr:hypothetical protein [Acidobacteriota bacterium]